MSTSEYQSAKEAKEIARASLNLAEKDYTGAHLDVEQARNELARAESQLSSARSALQEITGEGLERVKLEKQQAEMTLEEAEIAYKNTYLNAPVAGHIKNIHENEGTYVASGQEIVTLIPESDVTHAEVSIDEDLIGEVMPGQQAMVTTTAFPEREFTAEVTKVAPSIDPDRGTFTVKLELEDYIPELVTDLAIFVEIIIQEETEALVLNERYVYQADDKQYVYIEDNGEAYQQEVVSSGVGEDYALIEEGLQPGDMVLTDPDLTHGQQVRLVEE